MHKKTLNVANQITIFRIGVVPLIVALMYLPGPIWAWVAFVFFLLASVSDFLDGHIARRGNQVTSFGKFLDPLADKVLVASLLIALVDLGRIPGWIVVLIVCRELMVTGLRAVAASDGVVVGADNYGKIKTVVQMLSLGFLIVHYPALGMNTQRIGEILLYLALALTLFSGIKYFISFYRNWLTDRPTTSEG